jgi:rhodanese-related sulfurtransferase
MTDALSHYRAKLQHETDASDTYAALKAGEPIVIVDVRSEDAWKQGHVAGAIHMPYRDIAARAPEEIDPASSVVVYCWSPGCNAGAKGAVEFAQLGYRVREMIGGYEYWVREGYPAESAEGPLPRTFDPLVMYVRPSS